jgi:hypothetical protein
MAAERSFRIGRGVAEPHRQAVELDALFDGDNPLVGHCALSDLSDPIKELVRADIFLVIACRLLTSGRAPVQWRSGSPRAGG